MSTVDNWERLVAAVLWREHIPEFHQQSRSTSLSSNLSEETYTLDDLDPNLVSTTSRDPLENPSVSQEGKKMKHAQSEKKTKFRFFKRRWWSKRQKAGMFPNSAGTSSPALEQGTDADLAIPVEKLRSEPMSTPRGTPDAKILSGAFRDADDAENMTIYSPGYTNSAYISEDETQQQSADEITEDGMSLEDNSPANEMTTDLRGAESLFGQQKEIESTSSRAERSKHHEESISNTITIDLVPEEEHYSLIMENNRIKLKLDSQTILIGDYPSSASPESSPVTAFVYLVEEDLRELPEKPDFHNPMLLFLQRNKRLTLIHPSFFDSMPDLCFLDLSDTRIRILPSSLFRLPKLKVLILRNCVCLEKLPSEIGNLKHMEVLDLSGTELYNLPDEIGQLTLLRHMWLSFYGPDDESEYDHLPSELVSPSLLLELKELQGLSITVHPEDHRWTNIVACITKDVGKLEMLSYLQFYFLEVEMFENFIQMSPSWNKHILSKFHFILGHNVKRIVSRVPDEVESLFHQQDKCLRFVNGDKVTQVIKSVLIQVTAFYLDHHIEIQSLSELGISNLQALKFCVVRECPKIQAILDEKTAEGAFPCLEHLGIYYLWELKHIWKPPPPPGRLKRILKTPLPCGNFKALKHLIVNTCPKLQFVLWASMLQCLSNLEELVVEDCECVERIIKEENKQVKHNNMMLPGLRKLVLHYLPELVSLGNGLRLSKEKISVYGCPKLDLESQPRK